MNYSDGVDEPVNSNTTWRWELLSGKPCEEHCPGPVPFVALVGPRQFGKRHFLFDCCTQGEMTGHDHDPERIQGGEETNRVLQFAES